MSTNADAAHTVGADASSGSSVPAPLHTSAEAGPSVAPPSSTSQHTGATVADAGSSVAPHNTPGPGKALGKPLPLIRNGKIVKSKGTNVQLPRIKAKHKQMFRQMNEDAAIERASASKAQDGASGSLVHPSGTDNVMTQEHEGAELMDEDNQHDYQVPCGTEDGEAYAPNDGGVPSQQRLEEEDAPVAPQSEFNTQQGQPYDDPSQPSGHQRYQGAVPVHIPEVPNRQAYGGANANSNIQPPYSPAPTHPGGYSQPHVPQQSQYIPQAQGHGAYSAPNQPQPPMPQSQFQQAPAPAQHYGAHAQFQQAPAPAQHYGAHAHFQQAMAPAQPYGAQSHFQQAPAPAQLYGAPSQFQQAPAPAQHYGAQSQFQQPQAYVPQAQFPQAQAHAQPNVPQPPYQQLQAPQGLQYGLLQGQAPPPQPHGQPATGYPAQSYQQGQLGNQANPHAVSPANQFANHPRYIQPSGGNSELGSQQDMNEESSRHPSARAPLAPQSSQSFHFIHVDVDAAKVGHNGSSSKRPRTEGTTVSSKVNAARGAAPSQSQADTIKATTTSRAGKPQTPAAPRPSNAQGGSARANTSQATAGPSRARNSQSGPSTAGASTSTPTLKERAYVRPTAPPAYVASPRAAEKAPRRGSTAGPPLSEKTRQHVMDVLEAIQDEEERDEVMQYLFPDDGSDADETDMDVEISTPEGRFGGDTSRQKHSDPPVALILDKVHHVEEVVRDEAAKAQKFQESIEEALTQMKRDMSDIKGNSRTHARHVLNARREVGKTPRGSRSRLSQLQETLPQGFDTWAPQDRQRWLRVEKNHLDQLGANVRAHLKHLLEYDSWEDLVDRHPALPEAKINRIKKPGVTVYSLTANGKFHIEFTRSWTRCPYNIAARREFIKHFLNSVAGGWYPSPPVPAKYLTEKHVGGALDTYMETCRREYRAVVDPPSPTKVAKRAEEVARSNRRRVLLDQRVTVVDRRGWTKFDALFDKLAPDNMSGDETDGGKERKKRLPARWAIIESKWPSEKFKKCVRGLDAHYKGDWKNPRHLGKGKRKSCGNPPRIRRARKHPKIVEGVAPVGLWRNCYNEKWLASLPEWEIEKLQIIDEDFDLELPVPPPPESDVPDESSSEDAEEDDAMTDDDF